MHKVYARLTKLIAVKRNEHYSTVSWRIKRKLVFSIMNSVGLCLRGSRSAYNNGDNKESMNRDASTTEGMLNIKIQTIKLCYSYSQCKDVLNFMWTCLAPLTQQWNIFYCWFEFNYNNILYLYIPLLLLTKKLKIPYPHINKHSILIRNTPPSLSLSKSHP